MSRKQFLHGRFINWITNIITCNSEVSNILGYICLHFGEIDIVSIIAGKNTFSASLKTLTLQLLLFIHRVLHIIV